MLKNFSLIKIQSKELEVLKQNKGLHLCVHSSVEKVLYQLTPISLPSSRYSAEVLPEALAWNVVQLLHMPRLKFNIAK